nr:hypothetical protein [Tanacetum cinerariifolium]
MKNVLKDNERLLEQAISVDIVNIVVYDHLDSADKTVNRNNSFSQKSAPTFDQPFEINDLKAQSQEKDTVIVKLKERLKSLCALKETLCKLKGKAIVTKAVTLHPIDPALLKIDVAPLAPKLRNNRTAHTDYLRHTQEETATLRKIVEKTKLLAVTPKNNNKKIRLTKNIPTSGNTPVKTTSSTNPQGNTKNDRIQREPSKVKTNKLEDHHRTVRPSLNKKKSVVDTKAISFVTTSKLNANADLKCATCNGCFFLIITIHVYLHISIM